MLAPLGLNPVILLSPCAHAPGAAPGGPQEIMNTANERYQEALAADTDALSAYLTRLEELTRVTGAGRTQTRIPTTYGFLEETWTACRILVSRIVELDAGAEPAAVAAFSNQAVRLLRYGEQLVEYFNHRPGDARGAIPFVDLCLAFQMVRAIFPG
jgi:hypothetical protein